MLVSRQKEITHIAQTPQAYDRGASGVSVARSQDHIVAHYTGFSKRRRQDAGQERSIETLVEKPAHCVGRCATVVTFCHLEAGGGRGSISDCLNSAHQKGDASKCNFEVVGKDRMFDFEWGALNLDLDGQGSCHIAGVPTATVFEETRPTQLHCWSSVVGTTQQSTELFER